jgi:ribosomal protein S8
MDKIGDLLNRIATANQTAKAIKVQNSKYKREILKVLYDEGWIAGITVSEFPKHSAVSVKHLSSQAPLEIYADSQPSVKVDSTSIGKAKELIIFLKRPYVDASASKGSINEIQSSGQKLKIVRFSKPGRRLYYTAKQSQGLLLKVAKISNTILISTNKGVMTINKAVELNLGGELLFKIST